MKDWKSRLTTPDEAIKSIKSGQRIFIGTACGSPQSLVRALTSAAAEDVEILQVLSLGIVEFAQKTLAGKFRSNTFFIGKDIRERVQQGDADYTPIFFSEIPVLFKTGRVPIDVALITLSLPDEHGYCSFGITVDITKPAAESAKIVIAEINPNMPRTLGDSFIHIDDLDYLVYSEEPILEFSAKSQPEIVKRIAKNVVDLIEDGSTIQVGYGGVPTAILGFLAEKKDLGIHTEVFSDNLIELIEKGIVNNRKKTIHKGKCIASFAMGTRKLYDYLNNNPIFEFHPIDYTNDPFVIAQNEKMVAINSAIEIDLTGQVCADSIGYRFYSGIGGQLDFVRGAARSRGGKPIIVIPSVRSDGKSRIVPHLNEGAGVVTTRGDVHFVVTEWGGVNLHGKSIRERALALISIAHPDFRAELLRRAKELNFVYQDQSDIPLVHARYPDELEIWDSSTTGEKVFLRPVKPTDEPLLRQLFYTFSAQTVYYRFFSYINAMPHEKLSKFVNIDYRNEMVIVAALKQAHEEKMIGMAGYGLDKATGLAEFAFVVTDEWQNKGIGTLLFSNLIKIAKMQGIKGFIGYVLDTNVAAYRLIHKMSYPVKTKWEDGIYTFTIMFQE